MIGPRDGKNKVSLPATPSPPLSPKENYKNNASNYVY